jgi:uncharacterized protein (DUF1499 family)
MPALFGRLFAGSPPSVAGARDGELAPCPDRPNCVSSRATSASQAIAPLAYASDAAHAWRRLVDTIGATRGARVVSDDGRQLHAEFASATLGFVDDVDCVLDPAAKVIHVRSASRLGRYDFGVNRKRVERLRGAVAGAAAS